MPLRIAHRRRWRPEEEYWGAPGDPLEPAIQEVVAGGPRDALGLEQVVPGRGWETSDDPILEAVELTASGERAQARRLLEGLLTEDLRCLDAHAHLGSFAYDYSAALALTHFETGVAIGERSLPAGFDGILPWGWIDNRPFLRCLHGYGLCLWRLGRFAGAEAVFVALLWLNPSDNQGARELVKHAKSDIRWEPPSRDADQDALVRGAGRRKLLDRAATILDAPPRTPSEEEIEAEFEPLLWLLDRGRADGLPLTQTGAIGRAIVREAAVRFPDWWDAELFGPPHREAELALLEALHALGRRARLLRRRKRRLLITARAKRARQNPEGLLEALAPISSTAIRSSGRSPSSRARLSSRSEGSIATSWGRPSTARWPVAGKPRMARSPSATSRWRWRRSCTLRSGWGRSPTDPTGAAFGSAMSVRSCWRASCGTRRRLPAEPRISCPAAPAPASTHQAPGSAPSATLGIVLELFGSEAAAGRDLR